jgi:hypothetical protein
MHSRVMGLAAGALVLAGPVSAASDDLHALASEARQTIAVIDWFYVRHRACPQPSRPEELRAMEAGLGDGFSLEPDGRFIAIRGISMSGVWHYYAPAGHPDRCTLWRSIGPEPVLVWHRRGGAGRWAFYPGDGSAERPLQLRP